MAANIGTCTHRSIDHRICESRPQAEPARSCLKNRCPETKRLSQIDGFHVLNAICVFFGICWFFLVRKRLQFYSPMQLTKNTASAFFSGTDRYCAMTCLCLTLPHSAAWHRSMRFRCQRGLRRSKVVLSSIQLFEQFMKITLRASSRARVVPPPIF
jgi:hypothetical protein